MCGICGFTNYKKTERDPIPVIRRMNSELSHRGPDGSGFSVASIADGVRLYSESQRIENEISDCDEHVLFAHSRLSIIDVESGAQPISNEDGSVVIVVNGEIYNHQELRSELETKGHLFKTHSDSESILHLYEDIGADCFTKLNGMFACAIWDNKKQLLVLGRDRFGQKPLYYTEVNGNLVFGSELKAVLKHPAVDAQIDNVSLSQYFAYEYVPAPRTIYKNISKLPAGCFAEFSMQNGGCATVEVQQYWSYITAVTNKTISENDAANRLSELFEQSVQRRLMSDVPLGVFLSGGLDSSMTAAMACRHAQRRVKTFSVAFDDPSFDESSHARKVAGFLGTEHYEKRFHVDELYQSIDDIISNLDEPMADSSLLPTYLLSKFTREHVTVALGGDGADELFCGYPTFQAHKAAQLYRHIPSVIHNRAINPLVNLLPVSHKNMSFDFKLKQFLKGAHKSPEICQQYWLGAFADNELGALLEPGVYSANHDIYAPSREYFGQSAGDDMHNRMSQLYVNTYLQDDILTKVDRASMAVSLEARTPFLDVDFAEFAATVPGNMKLNRLTTKHILKKTARGLIPDEIIDRPKKGFGIPIGKWFKNELKNRITDPSFAAGLAEFGVREEKVEQLVTEHLRGAKDNRKQLWALFVLNSFGK